MRYILQHTWLSRQQCDAIQSTVLSAVLPKIKLNRKFPRAIIHGGHKYGGINLPTHYHEQGALIIQYILCKLRKNDTQTKLLRISIKHLQLEYGGTTTVFGKVQIFPQYITTTWITNAWRFLHAESLHIRIASIQIQELQRFNDSYIMDHFQHIPLQKLLHINRCRI